MLRMYVYPDLVRITREINRALFNDITDLLSRHNIQPATPDFMDIGGGLGMAQWAFVSEAGAIEAGDLIADYFRSIPRRDVIIRHCVSGCGSEIVERFMAQDAAPAAGMVKVAAVTSGNKKNEMHKKGKDIRNENVLLEVSKDSPHIWGGGLEDTDLAKWLIGKANAILSQQQRLVELEELKAKVSDFENSSEMLSAYVSLGLSRQECDPILAPSKEAIQFDIDLVDRLPRIASCEQHRAVQIFPVGYSQLSDLAEERKAYREKTIYQSAQVSNPCE